MSDYLKKDDYEEPRCLLNMNQGGERINLRRVISTLDAYLGKNDYDAGERHLKYWIMEADNAGDMHGKLSVLNEQIGLYRKVGKKVECLEAIKGALELADLLDMQGTITYGTTLVNAATGYKSFGMVAEAMPLYRRAQEVYESVLEPDDEKVGTLYNNMALALTDLEQYAEARSYYEKALQIMKKKEFGELEEAITYLNLADLAVAEHGHEKAEEMIGEYLDKAEELLDTPSVPRNGYYAFVCDKCAPVFGYYGYFLTEKKFKERAQKIYEGN
ncbi:MAG: tetratricopeptide repeat protein [Erysipelotrichaceae bacterium]|nr:tetratricopeptide repeat protein [Erysipelotrichaceae bacterium]